jgi:hypothetical protein
LVGTTADFRRFGHPQPLPINHLLCENRRTQGRMGEVGLGPPLPPGKVDEAAVISLPEIDQQEFDRLLSTDQGIRISGTITYSDAYKGDYETTFCLAKLATGAVHYCTDRNGNSMR